MHPAHEQVLALVSGLSLAKRAERRLCVLQAYIDDSGEAGKVLILAGYLATVEQWLRFSERWQQALDMSPPWLVFKMRAIDMKIPEQRERAEYHYRIIEEFLPGGFCVAIPIKPLKLVCEELNIGLRWRRPYYMAWIAVISVFRKFYTKGGWKQSLDLIFDEQIESKIVLEAYDILTMKQNGDMAPFKNRPIFRNDEEFLPLQAADLLAWWARKRWLEKETFVDMNWLFPWEGRTPAPDYIFSEMTEDQIREHMKTGIEEAKKCPSL